MVAGWAPPDAAQPRVSYDRGGSCCAVASGTQQPSGLAPFVVLLDGQHARADIDEGRGYVPTITRPSMHHAELPPGSVGGTGMAPSGMPEC